MPSQVFVGAFACEPGRGSEPGAGWELVRASASAAKEHGVSITVLTRPHRVPVINATLRQEGLGRHVTVVPVKVPLGLHRLGPRFIRLAYVAWQVNAARELRRRIRKGDSALYHHVTFATTCIPTVLPLLPRNVRIVFGPATGTSTGRRDTARAHLRFQIQRALSLTNVRRADLLVAQNHLAEREWRRWGATAEICVEPNVVVDESMISAVLQNRAGRVPRKIVSVGRLIPLKRHDLTIRALANERLEKHSLTIIGEGPEEPNLRALVDTLGLTGRVRLTGHLPRKRALQEVAEAECCVLASDSEGAGWIVGEAQALGVIPVVRGGTGAETVLRFGGVGQAFSSDAGPKELADVVASVSDLPPPAPSSRWARSRLPDLLSDWYGLD
jgi:glycosyltransferase involved in cell wall biosynthesis